MTRPSAPGRARVQACGLANICGHWPQRPSHDGQERAPVDGGFRVALDAVQTILLLPRLSRGDTSCQNL